MIPLADNPGASSELADQALARYDRAQGAGADALEALCGVLRGGPEQAWLECVQALVLRQQVGAAIGATAAALLDHPHSSQLLFARAGLVLEHGDAEHAESLLRGLLDAAPEHVAAALLLARVFKQQGRMHAAAGVIGACFRRPPHDTEQVIRAIELLDECARERDAANLCEAEIAAGCRDPRLHAYAGMLLSQLGQFELARQRQEFALASTPLALEWHVPHGLSGQQRYDNPEHADFERFRQYLQRQDISDQARASLLFSLGKAHDDIGDYGQAADYFRQANALVHATTRWSRKLWRRSLEARMQRKPPAARLTAPTDWAPLLVVGMPRSGTSVLAERLARHPDVCGRGELPWLPALADQLGNATVAGSRPDRLEHAAAAYAAQLRQDDSKARWMLDKQPHNFLHIDLMLAMFPRARILFCRRHARDNALSVWMQSFQPGAQDYASDFTDIGAVIQGSRRLLKHWLARYPGAIFVVDYEDLTSDAAGCLEGVLHWLGLPPHDLLEPGAEGGTIISTASLWQARQPIHGHSVGRWKNYLPHLPELLQIPEF